jgi:hypothetical protein
MLQKYFNGTTFAFSQSLKIRRAIRWGRFFNEAPLPGSFSPQPNGLRAFLLGPPSGPIMRIGKRRPRPRVAKLNLAAPVTISVMLKSYCFSFIKILLATSLIGISACSPTYDWREVRGPDAPFVVLLPAKPTTHTRDINLDGTQLPMTMTAAQVDGITFAVGSATLPDHAVPQAALTAMKTAMVRNIGGTIKREKAISIPGSTSPSIEVEAVGASGGKTAEQPILLLARFAEKDRRIYQAVVVGPEKAVARDQADTFFTSLKLN